MFRVGQTVFAIVTDHPAYPREVYVNGENYAVFSDEAVAREICDGWNSDYTSTSTPQPWPFYVEAVVVKAAPPAGRQAKHQLSLDIG